MKYFTEFLVNSTDSSDKAARKTEKFSQISSAFKPGEDLKTKARVKFLLYITELTRPFLKQFQSAKPNIHNLYTNSVDMFEAIAKLVMKPRKFRNISILMGNKDTDWFDEDIILSPDDCTSLVSIMQEELEGMVGGVKGSRAKNLLNDARYSVLIMMHYLFQHLPISDKLLRQVGFLHPRAREAWNGADGPSLVDESVSVAKKLNRFNTDELLNLQIQMSMYQSLVDVPDYEEKDDRIDHWWMKVFKLIENARGEPPKEAMKLVKMVLVLPNSQGWVERGFNVSKMFAEDRESLSVESMKALKVVFGEIKRQGGADKVVITTPMLNSVKMSGREAREAAARERVRKEQEAATQALEREAERKRKAVEDAKRNWDARKKELESELKVVQQYIDNKQKFINDTLSKMAKSSDPYKIKDWSTALRLANEDKSRRSDKERNLQEELRKHMGKRKQVAE